MRTARTAAREEPPATDLVTITAAPGPGPAAAVETDVCAAHEAYVVTVHREILRLASARRRGFDADDLAQEIVAELLPHLDEVMAAYTDPVRWARVRFQHGGISFDRSQRVQRGEGARLGRDADGLPCVTREVVSGDVTPPDGGPSLLTTVPDHGAGFDAEVIDRLEREDLIGRCSEGLTADEFDELMLVDGHGLTVGEVAVRRGQRRETVSRRLSRTRSTVAERAMRLRHGASVLEVRP